MTAQTATKVTVPVGGDGWNPVAHIKGAFETARTIIPVADLSERDGLAAFFPGGVLPIPTYVGRMDRDGDIEVWTGSVWRGAAVETVNPLVTDPLWSFAGQLSKASSPGGKRTVTVAENLQRVGSDVTMTTAYKSFITGFVPSGWRPIRTHNGWALLTASDDSPLAQLWWRITIAGDLQVRLESGATSIVAGNKLHLSGNWTTAA